MVEIKEMEIKDVMYRETYALGPFLPCIPVTMIVAFFSLANSQRHSLVDLSGSTSDETYSPFFSAQGKAIFDKYVSAKYSDLRLKGKKSFLWSEICPTVM